MALTEFLMKGLTAYHAVDEFLSALDAHGYTPLKEEEGWQIALGGKYYVVRNSSSVIAFSVPEVKPRSYLMASAHSDSPVFKIKELTEDEKYTRLTVEKYGGMIPSTWFDRPLAIAGRIMLEKEGSVYSKTVTLNEKVVIPSVAIHMYRDTSVTFNNPAVDLLPLVGGKGMKARMEKALSLLADGARILSRDLFVIPDAPAMLWGAEEEYISSPRLDDLQCVYAILSGILDAKPTAHVALAAILDSEEVGSKTMQGADASFLSDTLLRISDALGATAAEHRQMLSQSFMISADNAHAVHPNHPEYSDARDGRCYMNEGIVIKHSAAKRYTTDAYSEAVLLRLCAIANVPVQHYYNRADMLGGSTLAHLSVGHISVHSVDIGLAQLAMHSSYETAGMRDTDALAKMLSTYFSAEYRSCGTSFTLQ